MPAWLKPNPHGLHVSALAATRSGVRLASGTTYTGVLAAATAVRNGRAQRLCV